MKNKAQISFWQDLHEAKQNPQLRANFIIIQALLTIFQILYRRASKAFESLEQHLNVTLFSRAHATL